MSAIAGICYFDGRRVDEADIERMLDSLSRRGPDGGDSWLAGGVGFGQRMLRTTPESLHEPLPLVEERAGLALTADARIDNRAELIALLGLGGSPGEIPDSELILRAYQRWGKACPEKLVGDFAFAIWDERHQELFCARDPMGIKPLYFYHRPGRSMIFASQLRTLLCLKEIPRRLNELRVAEHLAFLEGDRGQTFYRDIQRLPAAHCLAVSETGMRVRRYWDLDPQREIRLPDDEAYAQAFLEVFNEAVRSRLRSAFPVGSLLSGGLDSSSIVAVARELTLQENGKDSLHTISAVFPTLSRDYPRIDERPWIDAVVAQGNLQAHYVAADRLDPLEALSFDEDEPLAIPNLWLDWGCFQAAHQAGLRVILSGYDGDTAISYGFGYLAELARTLHWGTLLEEARIKAARQGKTLRRLFKEEVIKVLLPPTAMKAWWKLRRRQTPPPFPFDPPINPVFARRLGLGDHARSLVGEPFQKFNTARELHRQDVLSSFMLLGPELLDKIGAFWGIEPRLPFFDQRVLEFAVALPTAQKGRQGWNRYILRKAMQGSLPSQVQWRQGKGNLSPNVRRGLWERRATLEAEIQENLPPIEEFVNVEAVQASYQRFLVNPMLSSDADLFTILVAVTLVRWLEHARPAW